VGGLLGVLFQALDAGLEPALITAVVTLADRVLAAIAYRGRQLARIMAEEAPTAELRYVVPSEARAPGTSAPPTSSSSRRSAAAHSAATSPTSESSLRSTAWTARRSTRAGCTR
jgi:hypothetical protein